MAATTTEAEPENAERPDADLSAPAPPGTTRAGWAIRTEVLAALEVFGLVALAFTRPILDSFGRSPETFIARHASTGDVVLFALAVAVLPALAVVLLAAATRVAGLRARRWVHVVIVGVLGAVAVGRFGSDVALGRTRVLLVAAAVAAGALLAVARYRIRPTATYLRFLGAASVVFVAQFLVFSPASALVRGGDATTGGPAAAVEAPDEVPPIVVVVLDALPTVSLLDGSGRIDADLYPNLASLAGDATWYRNNTTVSSFTYQVVPAMLSGRLPDASMVLPDTRAFPDNLFTLFSETHDIEAVEQITRLCPPDACAPPAGTALPTLLGDAVDWWRGALETVDAGEAAQSGAVFLPGALEPDRGEDFSRWIGEQDFSAGGRPGLWFYHVVLPHEPWDLLPDGSRYEDATGLPYGIWLNYWDDIGIGVGRQRQVLQTQAVDRMLGELFDRLREAGTYDDTLIVVAGDHGQAIDPDSPLRGVGTSQFEQVAWAPMIVKAPHQDEGVVDDRNMWSIDLVPTIAEVVGVDLPWEADGLPASRLDERDPGDKEIIDQDTNLLEPEPGSLWVQLDADLGFDRLLVADWVQGEGELAVWQGGEHGALVGQDVAALRVGATAGGSLEIDQLDRIEHPGDHPPLLEVVSVPSVPRPGDVALAVNGEVAAVASVEIGPSGDPLVHALLLPEPFTTDNEVTAYLVEGEAGSETLVPLDVTAA